MKKIFFFLLLLSSSYVSNAQIKISAMPTATGNPDNVWIPVLEAGINKKIQGLKFKAYDSIIMQSHYQTDTMRAHLYTALAAIGLKVNYSDTAAMLANYKHWLYGYLKAADIVSKVNFSDTAAMLANYKHWLQGYLKAADIAGKLNISDTAVMLANYLRNTYTPPAAILSNIGAATGSNTINNLNNVIEWQWNTLGNGYGYKITSNSTAGTSFNTKSLVDIEFNGASANSDVVNNGLSIIMGVASGTRQRNNGLYISAVGQTALYVGAGNVGLQQGTATAMLHLGAGGTSAGSAPLKFTDGFLTTTPEAGSVQYMHGLWVFDSSNSKRDTMATRSWVRNALASIGAGGGYTAPQIDSLAYLASLRALRDSTKRYYFESTDSAGGIRVFYKANDTTLHFVTFYKGNGILIDTIIVGHDTSFRFRVDPSVIPTISMLTDSLNGIRTALAGKQATLISGANLRTVGSTSLLGSGDIPISGGGGGGSQTPWTSPINANQFSLNNALNIEAKKTIVGTGENWALYSDSLNASAWSTGGTVITDNVLMSLDGAMTIDSLNVPSNLSGEVFQIDDVNEDTRYYLSFEASKPTSGAIGGSEYFVQDWGGSYSTIINNTSYTLTTTLQRFVVPFTTPHGTTQIKFKPFNNPFSTGSFYMGNIVLTRDSLAAYDGPYQHTTSSQVFGTLSSENFLIKTDSAGSRGHVMVNTNVPTSAFTIGKSESHAFNVQSGNYTATIDDYFIISTAAGTATINLPPASTCSGRVYGFKNEGTSLALTLDPDASETIDGASTLTFSTLHQTYWIMSNGTGWYVMYKN